eukprot:m.92247 g.92247  ORF g.92247 m.92247 type:complete len:176 (-) comp26531_c0_seq1:373-900(-)
MAEVHVIGELVGGKDFPSSNLFCKWGAVAGGGWKALEGLVSGQTQVDHPADSSIAKWSHPIDIHYSTKGIQGWPKLFFEVWHQDIFGRNELYGYGFCYVPTSAGNHDVEVATWRPIGSAVDQAQSYFIGGGMQLKSADLVYNSDKRYRLQTQAMGTIVLKLGIITRNFDKYGVEN